MWPSPDTSWPISSPSTAAPSAAISPANSWPMMRGAWIVRCAQSSQAAMWRSVPQMPVDRTRTSTSFGPIVGTGTSTSERPGSGPSLRRARMVSLTSGLPVSPIDVRRLHVGVDQLGGLGCQRDCGDTRPLLRLGAKDPQLLGEGAGLLLQPRDLHRELHAHQQKHQGGDEEDEVGRSLETLSLIHI